MFLLDAVVRALVGILLLLYYEMHGVVAQWCGTLDSRPEVIRCNVVKKRHKKLVKNEYATLVAKLGTTKPSLSTQNN